MSNCSSVTAAVLGKIGGFAMVSRDKNTNQDVHEMVYYPIQIKFA